MRFWDASAVVPLVIEEPMSEAMKALLSGDPDIAAWWATWVECSSAIYRRSRTSPEGARAERSREKLEMLARRWFEIQPTLELRFLAGQILAVHPLRAADALQLASALRWCDGEPGGREFVGLDGRLRDAAKKEGFFILPEAAR